MGATIILFTIALIVLVGAALAYASRGNPSAINVQGARVYSAVLLKQSADYRDAYSRYLFDGRSAAAMTFNTDKTSALDLFASATQYGTYQAPPPQALTTGATQSWAYNASMLVNGIGTATGRESVAYVSRLTPETCGEINNQLYGSAVIPVATTAAEANLSVAATVFDDASTGRATGCFQTSDGKNVFYTTLAES